MGLQLPGELTSLLATLGYTWPQADETKLFELANTWMAFPDRITAGLADADAAAQRVWTDNHDTAVEAFRATWQGPDSARVNLEDGATAAHLIGAGLMICAGIVLALKINVIVQLILLAIEIAQAIATAVATFGASLLEIPIFKTITQLVLDQLIDLALNAVLGG